MKVMSWERLSSIVCGLEGVKQAVVVAREEGGGQKRLVAYVVPSAQPSGARAAGGGVGGGAGVGAGAGAKQETYREDRGGERAEKTAEEVRALEAELIRGYREGLSARLPEYMVPSVFVLLERVPLTGNGKVDKKALPLPEGGGSEAVEYIEPRNEVEQALCEIWQEVLNREQVGVHDNFFSLGGDSILSIQMVSLLKARGVISINDIFQHQTVEQLAARAQKRVRRQSEERTQLERFGLLTEAERERLAQRGEYEDAYPMSVLQAGMVFHTQLEQFSGIYHDIVSEHVKCPWERGSFERALAACMEEHPMLRTGFLLDGERPLQVVHRRMELPLEVEDVRGVREEEQRAGIEQWREERKRQDSRSRAESGFVSELVADGGGAVAGKLAGVNSASLQTRHKEHGVPWLSVIQNPAGCRNQPERSQFQLHPFPRLSRHHKPHRAPAGGVGIVSV